MTDRENILQALKDSLKNLHCGFVEGVGNVYAVSEETINHTLEFLKEQEAIKPYMDYDGQDVWRCGKCGNSLMHPSYYESDEDAKNCIRYCSHCGQAVKWE